MLTPKDEMLDHLNIYDLDIDHLEQYASLELQEIDLYLDTE